MFLTDFIYYLIQYHLIFHSIIILASKLKLPIKIQKYIDKIASFLGIIKFEVILIYIKT